MHDDKAELLLQVADYYTAKLAEFGETPRGVDWNGAEGQQLRFEQLCKIIDCGKPFSINDFGCGYGALYEHLAPRYESFAYSGIDVSEKMILAATKRLPPGANINLLCSSRPDAISDYTVASGVFNVRMDQSDEVWLSHCMSTLDILDASSKRGFSFNCLTSYSDADKMRDSLYYADPGALFDFCKKRYSRHVALLHDYPLYEFTILVRKLS